MSVAGTQEYRTQGNAVSPILINMSEGILVALGLRPKKMKDASSNGVSLRSLIGNYSIFIRIAGLGGASALFMGAYCRYHLRDIRDSREQQEAQAYADVANRMHFIHSLAMLCMPMAHYPALTGSIMTVGTVLFSGPMYYRALSGNKRFNNFWSTIGGFCLIFSWLSLIL